jgi:hypothetical protein
MKAETLLLAAALTAFPDYGQGAPKKGPAIERKQNLSSGKFDAMGGVYQLNPLMIGYVSKVTDSPFMEQNEQNIISINFSNSTVALASYSGNHQLREIPIAKAHPIVQMFVKSAAESALESLKRQEKSGALTTVEQGHKSALNKFLQSLNVKPRMTAEALETQEQVSTFDIA